MKDIELSDHKIGQGKFGPVIQAKWRGLSVAVKQVSSSVKVDGMHREFANLIRLRHPNIVLCMGIAIGDKDLTNAKASSTPGVRASRFLAPDTGSAWVVSEYVDKSSLASILADTRTPLSWKQRVSLALDVARAMTFLHAAKPGLVHACLSSSAVLVNHDMVAKLSDCEFAALQGITNIKPQPAPHTQSPEMLKRSRATRSGDVYSFGILLWELFTRRKSLHGFPASGNNVKLLKGIIAGDRPAIPEHIPAPLADLIRQCWHADVATRPGFAGIVHTLEAIQAKSWDVNLTPYDPAPAAAKGKAAAQQRADADEEADAFFEQLQKQPWVVPFKDIQCIRQIGKGSVGEVWEARYNNHPTAVKLLRARTRTERAQVLREAAILYTLRHPRIVLFQGACIEPGHEALLMEYCEAGSLRAHLSSSALHGDYTETVGLLAQIADALHYLHSRTPPVLHRDLKTANVLLDSHLGIKLCDFSLAHPTPSNSASHLPHVGTVAYQAPEVLESGTYTPAADIYSFAILACEAFSREAPYKSNKLSAHQLMLAVIGDGLRPTLPPFLTPELADLIRQCWHRDPAARPSAATLMSELDRLQHTALPRLELGPHNAKLYTKKHGVIAFRSKDRVSVRKSWGLGEGKKGDYVIIGPGDDVYTCDADVFRQTYERVPGGEVNAYRKTQRIFARRCSKDCLITTHEGLEYAHKGDYIAQNPNDGEQWPIAKFEEMYMLAEDQTVPQPEK
jgi:serine/threonine protein kinase